MFLRQKFVSIIAPTRSEKQVGNLIFTIRPLQMTLLVYWPKDNILSDDVSSDALWWEESARHSLHQTRQEGLLWDSDQN